MDVTPSRHVEIRIAAMFFREFTSALLADGRSSLTVVIVLH